MKATIVSTSAIVEMKDAHGNPFAARVWEGETMAGVAFTAYIPVVQVRSKADNREFARDLQECKEPSAETLRALRAIDLRLVI